MTNIAETKSLVDHSFVMTIDGQSVTSVSVAPVYNPATGSVVAHVPVATREVLDRAVESASRAFDDWSRRPIAERQAAVSAIGDRLEARAEEFMELLTLEQGKPRAMAEWEVYGSVAWFREIAKQSLPEEVLEDTPERRVISRHTPLGVVGAIVPWNFPILLAVWKIAPALVAGDTMIVKPSPFTPLCDLALVEMVQDLLPPGVLSAVSGDDELGKWITSHPGIAKIAFTGSTETGKHVMRSAAETLKRVTLELGGNDPAIVLGDVDPIKVAPQVFWAAFQNNAQFCNAAKRIYIHDSVYDAFRDELVAYAKTVVVGDGADEATQLGPIQNAPQLEKVKEYFDDCAKNGYTFALGGEIDDSTQGWFVPVTIVDNPPEDSRLVVEEPFGPILPLLKWSDEDDVVRRANDTVWGLGATVWGNDLASVERIGRQLDAGTVWLNEVHQYSPHQVFGGHKQSGIGAENSLHGLAEYTNYQTITLNKVPGSVA
ncbi:aldehyde dehydrogenase family protein [Rhodococcus sp. WS1]|uniref:aldehyde dehydrogenase family protein n=1 Tax=unclassified Rhodococcus (in: high G+C Gram-positive bacteria) TaxID=192944 RepID=UPI001143BE2B|nr:MULTISPECIES: aldehyde dehydrogenase family protein [unclassified Rhodococcus (in: high G+C Gram-positive bacteria)]ROZ52778.1 aldehyde dehydrogenase family protein [Rhodococcus sp. WS1]TQC34302.1 aldehyde dehydrogenase family protein [Rhodococcus sp. WS7]